DALAFRDRLRGMDVAVLEDVLGEDDVVIAAHSGAHRFFTGVAAVHERESTPCALSPHLALVSREAVERSGQGIDLDARGGGAEAGEKSQMADAPIAEVEQPLPGYVPQARFREDLQRSGIGERSAIASEIVVLLSVGLRAQRATE